MATPIDPRQMRGLQLLQAARTAIRRIDATTYQVRSQTNAGLRYAVVQVGEGWQCECPDHRYRGVVCKHIHAVLVHAFSPSNGSSPTTPAPLDAALASCRSCNGPVIRYGRKRGKQVWKCTACGRKQVRTEPGFEVRRYDPEIITAALDLYYKGVSLRKIAQHLSLTNGLRVSPSTIYRWLAHYVRVLDAYVKDLAPEVSGVWHADEMKVRAQGGWRWLWNILDHETRFQLASVLTTERGGRDAARVFETADVVAKQKPEAVVTDALGSYRSGLHRYYRRQKQAPPEHLRNVGIQANRLNNNLVERLHNTIRERTKVQRGFKTPNTPLVPGQQIYYNFIRPHMALHNKTPAEAAQIPLDLQGNKWLDLIRRMALKQRLMGASG